MKYSSLNKLALTGFLSLLGFSASIHAVPVTTTINDNIIGNNAYCQNCGGYQGAANKGWTNQDVIGAIDKFDISKMVVTRNGSLLDILIYSRYLNNIGELQTELGDLLISLGGVDGTWEYAIKLPNRKPAAWTSGTTTLALLTGSPILSYVPNNYIYRFGEAYRAGTNTDVASATWGLYNNGTTTDTDDYLKFSLNYAPFTNQTLGLSYTYSCGNDVIRANIPPAVPEPGTLGLLGLGVAALGFVYRKKARSSK